MKKIIRNSFTIGLLCFLAKNAGAQQTIAAAGNNASGSGGTVTYSIGQIVYTTNGSAGGSIEQGVQIVHLNNPLPLELVSFDGRCKGDGQVQLNWETASEENNDQFEVEKSEDAINWSLLTTIKGKGASTTIRKYTYTDSKVNGPVTYYRLQQTDVNNKTTYSNIIHVVNCIEDKLSIVLYPNPASDGIYISIENFAGTTYELSDVKGSILGTGNLSGQVTYIPLSKLATATYFIKIRHNNNQIKTFKIFKQ